MAARRACATASTRAPSSPGVSLPTTPGAPVDPLNEREEEVEEPPDEEPLAPPQVAACRGETLQDSLNRWIQKQKGTFNKLLKMARESGHSYLGPTPMSELVCNMAATIDTEFNELLSDVAQRDIGRFGLIWHMVPPGLHGTARELIVSLTLRCKASF